MGNLKSYVEAPPEIGEMAAELASRYGLAEAATARVKYLFKHDDKLTSELGYISRGVGHWKYLTEYDFVVVLWAEWWAEAPQWQREANLLHQLLHIGRSATNQWEVRKHPIECFPEEVAAYGAWNFPLADLVEMVRAAGKAK